MFDLEQSIAEWRRQMLAAGIKSPVPLEELESHLREEFNKQVMSGIKEQTAFEAAVVKIGEARELKAEFVKERSLLAWLGNDKLIKRDRILGTLWLVFCSWGFALIGRSIIFHLASASAGQSPGLLMALLLLAVYGTGIIGSFLLILSSKSGRNIVRIIVGLFALFGLVLTMKSFSIIAAIFTTFYFVTFWLLCLPLSVTPKTAAK